MQEISLLPNYVKQISRFLFLCNFALNNAGTEMLNKAYCIRIYFLRGVPDSMLIRIIIIIIIIIIIKVKSTAATWTAMPDY